MKKIMRNGTFLRDSNRIADMLRLPFGHIIVTGMSEQFPVMTQDDARLYLGMLCSTSEISFRTADQIMKQVECARLVASIVDVARQVDKFRLPRDHQYTENFTMCGVRRNHGHFRLRGLDGFESSLYPVDSFAFGFRLACELVEEGRVKPLDTIWALQQLRSSGLPIDTQIFDDPKTAGFGSIVDTFFGIGDPDIDDLEDMFKSDTGNPTKDQKATEDTTEKPRVIIRHPAPTSHEASPPEPHTADNPEPSITTRTPEVPGPEAANAGVNQQM